MWEQDYYFSILLAYRTMECSLKSPTSYVTNRISFPFSYFVFTWGENLGTRQISLNIIRLTHTDVWESMGKPCSCIQFIRSCIFTTSHARIRISTTSYMRIRIRYCRSRVLHLNMQWDRSKIIITIVLNYTGKNITRLLPLALLLVHSMSNNTDGNKLRIFSGIALYYGDTYIININHIASIPKVSWEEWPTLGSVLQSFLHRQRVFQVHRTTHGEQWRPQGWAEACTPHS